MKRTLLPLAAIAALLSSCATTVDEYNYGYAPAYRELPAGFKTAEIGGTTYWHHGGRFYKYDGDKGYLLVKPPRGASEVVAATGTATPAPNAAPTQAKERSWIMPGGGSMKDRDRKKQVKGRSPVRH